MKKKLSKYKARLPMEAGVCVHEMLLPPCPKGLAL